MAVRIPWDEYEVAYLLKACVDVENGIIARAAAVASVSTHLRERAVRRGIKIDEVFRNENGISMQFSALYSCYQGQPSGLTVSRLFRDVVNLYHNDPAAFNHILTKDAAHATDVSWPDFLAWLNVSYEKREVESIVTSLNMISFFGRKRGLIHSNLVDITDPDEIRQLHNAVKKPGSIGIQSKKNARSAIYALGIYLRFIDAQISISAENQVNTLSVEKEIDPQSSFDSTDDQFVDFAVNCSYAHTKPSFCSYMGAEIPCRGWNALYINLVKAIYRDHASRFPIGKNVTTGNRVDVGSSNEMIYPKLIGDGVYLECNVSASSVVNKIRAFLELCGISYENVVIRYRSTKTPSPSTANSSKTKNEWRPLYQQQVESILSKYYPYGFRLGSPIEIMRFRNFADREGIQLPSDDDLLMKEIQHSGLDINGMIHVFSNDELEYITFEIDCAFRMGIAGIFISPFMEQHNAWLEEHRIVSEEMFKELLKKVCPRYSYSTNMIINGEKKTETEVIVAEIHRVAQGRTVVIVDEICTLLPYVPSEKITWTLSASDEFVWISEGKYFIMNQFEITDYERTAIIEHVSRECQEKGYSTLSNIPLDAVSEQNYELSGNALYDAVYLAVLKDSYKLSGKILTSGQQDIDLTQLLCLYCRDRQSCTIEEVTEKAIELTGVPNRQHVFTALYRSMIRIDSDTFVSDSIVDFDIEAIDHALSGVVGHGFTSIRNVTTFALFPTTGYSWNHYLLESFCYRHSQEYRLSILNFNDKNAGMIYHKSLELDYDGLLSYAAAKADIPLTPEHIGEYFFANGYTAKRKYAHLPKIIERAAQIREEN